MNPPFKKNISKEIIPDLISSNQNQFYWLRAVVKKAGYEIPPRLNTIVVNAVNATQGQTIEEEIIETTEIERQGLPYQTVKLKNKPVLAGTLQLEIKEKDNTWNKWRAVADFDASSPNDRHYIIDLEEGLICFGNGLNGRIPPQFIIDQTDIRVSYKFGGGENGNVKAHTIQKIESSDLTLVTVDNPLPAYGGTEAESLQAAQHRIRKDLKKPYRAINDDDFTELALATPGLRLQRVKVLPLFHPNYPAIKIPGVVTVIVVPLSLPTQSRLPEPSKGFLDTVFRFLRPKCLVTTRLFVIGPKFIKININISVEIKPGKSAKNLCETITEKINNFFDPITGGIESKGWPFGRNVYKSEIYQVLQDIEGVHCIKEVKLTAENCFQKESGDILIPRTGLVYLKDRNFPITLNGTEYR